MCYKKEKSRYITLLHFFPAKANIDVNPARGLSFFKGLVLFTPEHTKHEQDGENDHTDYQDDRHDDYYQVPVDA